MRIHELINEAGLIGKLGSAVGKAANPSAQSIGKIAGAAVGLGQKFAQGAEKWKGTGFGLTPNKDADSGGGDGKLPGDVDPNELRDLLKAVLAGQQLNPQQQKVAQQVKDNI